jgi:hypothetical protein
VRSVECKLFLTLVSVGRLVHCQGQGHLDEVLDLPPAPGMALPVEFAYGIHDTLSRHRQTNSWDRVEGPDGFLEAGLQDGLCSRAIQWWEVDTCVDPRVDAFIEVPDSGRVQDHQSRIRGNDFQEC